MISKCMYVGTLPLDEVLLGLVVLGESAIKDLFDFEFFVAVAVVALRSSLLHRLS